MFTWEKTNSLYEKLRSIIYVANPPYQRAPGEAFLLEDTFYHIWSNNLIEKVQ